MRSRKDCLHGGVIVAVLCWVQAAAAADVPVKPVDGKIKWVSSYEEGQKQARQAGKPLFVVFRCER
jgi:hypothetical protein